MSGLRARWNCSERGVRVCVCVLSLGLHLCHVIRMSSDQVVDCVHVGIALSLKRKLVSVYRILCLGLL